MCPIFVIKFSRVSDLQGVKIPVFPLTLLVIVTTVLRYRAACDAIIDTNYYKLWQRGRGKLWCRQVVECCLMCQYDDSVSSYQWSQHEQSRDAQPCHPPRDESSQTLLGLCRCQHDEGRTPVIGTSINIINIILDYQTSSVLGGAEKSGTHIQIT